MATLTADTSIISPARVEGIDWRSVFRRSRFLRRCGCDLFECALSVQKVHKGTGYQLAVKFDQNYIVCGGGDTFEVNVYNASTLASMAQFVGHKGYVRSVAFTNTRLFSASADNHVIEWDLSTGTPLHKLKQAKNEVNAITLHSNLLFSASDDSVVRQYDANSHKVLHSYKQHTSGVYDVQFDGQYTLMTASTDCTLKIFDIRSPTTELFTLKHPKTVRAVTFDANEIYTVCFDDKMRVFDRNNLPSSQAAVYKKATGGTSHCVVKSDEVLLYAGAHRIVVMNRATRETIKTYGKTDDLSQEVYQMDFHDGQLATASFDGTVRMWSYEM
eukprot:TRINITY_DN3964_c0_g1_i1.p1 TRINITY_DN3964_c0_g1~~TRINITY_DN3964_c0_g1_i1.p1  ORF type:complete len:329 (+),score=71.49 TRINITY_DN3964_c0_g1_i1:39-1025(+)